MFGCRQLVGTVGRCFLKHARIANERISSEEPREVEWPGNVYIDHR